MGGQLSKFGKFVRDFALYYIDSFYQGTVRAFTESSTHGRFHLACYQFGWCVC